MLNRRKLPFPIPWFPLLVVGAAVSVASPSNAQPPPGAPAPTRGEGAPPTESGVPKPDAPVTTDSSAPSVPGTTTGIGVKEPPPPEAAKADAPLSAGGHEGRFEFGSYGRVQVGSDLRGGSGRGTNVVSFGPRLVDEGSYAELELRREDAWGERVKARVVATVGLLPPFFHFSGKPEQALTVRNLYAQGTYDNVTLWAGSRMYRGDDIYLLNWWPLDNQNTVGAGVAVPLYKRDPSRPADNAGGTVPGSTGYETILQLHAGQQRLDTPYQYQEVPVVAPFGVGSTNVVKLDRPRTIETAKLTQFIRPDGGPSGFKAILYGEAHELPSGTYQEDGTKADRALPSDSGWLLGSQLTYFTGKRDTYASLFLRHARGLAAYDPLAAPTSFAFDKSTSGASETRIALAGNYEQETFGVLFGSYVSFFRDASDTKTSMQKYDEGAVVARPSIFLGENFGISVEGSYQQRRTAVLQPGTENVLTSTVAKAGIMPYFSPSGRGNFKRPQLRLIYLASFRNAGTRALYPNEDVFSQRSVEHFAGVNAEWWFNFSSYP